MPPLTGYDYFMENALKYGWAVPQGVILMWKGSIATIPTGYVFCNGANDTPDLRDRFIVCAKEDFQGNANTWITGAPLRLGGGLAHDHTFTGGGHSHYINSYAETGYAALSDYGHYHSIASGDYLAAGSGYNYYTDSETTGITTDGHNHALTLYTDSNQASGTTDEQETLPPFYALAYIMKT